MSSRASVRGRTLVGWLMRDALPVQVGSRGRGDDVRSCSVACRVICSQQIDWFLGLRTRSGNALSLPLSSSLEMEEGELGSWRAPT